MSVLTWDQAGERVYETGVDRGVLYPLSNAGAYDQGFAWNGLTTITESPSGAESNKQYADNRVYANLISAEEFGCTIEAFTYPDAWEECDGNGSPTSGVIIGQQGRRSFGLSYRSLLGNDIQNTEYGYKLHLVWGATAAPSEKARATVNDSPEAMGLSWEVTTYPLEVGTVAGNTYKPTATMTIDSTKVDPTALATLEQALYGTVGTDAYLPLPAAVIAMFDGTVTTVSPVAPTYNSTTDIITIPSVTGVVYKVNGLEVTTSFGPISSNTVVTASPLPGYKFPAVTDDDWLFTYV